MANTSSRDWYEQSFDIADDDVGDEEDQELETDEDRATRLRLEKDKARAADRTLKAKVDQVPEQSLELVRVQAEKAEAAWKNAKPKVPIDVRISRTEGKFARAVKPQAKQTARV